MAKHIPLIVILLIATIGQAQDLPPFDRADQPAEPDYSDPYFWSALPFREDIADIIPKDESWISDSLKEVDVFYVYPTVYEKGDTWNADLQDKKLNKKIDEKPVKYQATVYNRTCRVYAPRYRQSIVKVFYLRDEDSFKSLDFAYEDVRNAFLYYMEHHNNGRLIIIAGHSQGGLHSRRLLQEFFDTTALMDQLVAAYPIGFPINDSMFQNLKMCDTEAQTGCYVSWHSFKSGKEPGGWFYQNMQNTNPITWTQEPGISDRSLNDGTVTLNIDKPRKHKTTAEIHQLPDGGEIIWVDTKAPLLKFFKNMHILDYNLFWMDIRENVADRVETWKNSEF